MKRIVYLTFYFKPDLSACSFRNSSLAVELAAQAKLKDISIDVYTTLPNRYSTFNSKALEYEEIDNLQIHRISLPQYKGGILNQVFSFVKYYFEVKRLNKGKKADLVFASSSKLFTAFLGHNIAYRTKSPLYLDIRDIFVDTVNSVFKSMILKSCILPSLKFIERKTFKHADHINLISGGFKKYFQPYSGSKFSFYTNGIDEEFLNNNSCARSVKSSHFKKLIVYAGNIGEGQGLHKIIPQVAKLLGSNFEFLIIGDGGTKKLLELEINKLDVNNVILKNPVNRKELKQVYQRADYLFLHLNDYPAFRKVLPSKIFELATFNKPILAGVSGYSAKFIKNEVSHSFVFEPCNIKGLADYLVNKEDIISIDRNEFINKFKRSKINEEMAASILYYL
jgi:hypothetical protein